MLEFRLTLQVTEFSSLWSIWQLGNIGSGNGLVPSRRRAIIWTSEELFYWGKHAALGLNELKSWQLSVALRTIGGVGVLKRFLCLHDDVIKCKQFPRFWPFVRGIHRSPATESFLGFSLVNFIDISIAPGDIQGGLDRQESSGDMVLPGQNGLTLTHLEPSCMQ